MFAREGYPLFVGATALAVVAFALALRVRSWPLWLVAFFFLVAAVVIAWFFRGTVA